MKHKPTYACCCCELSPKVKVKVEYAHCYIPLINDEKARKN